MEFLCDPDFVVTQDTEAGAYMMADRYDGPRLAAAASRCISEVNSCVLHGIR